MREYEALLEIEKVQLAEKIASELQSTQEESTSASEGWNIDFFTIMIIQLIMFICVVFYAVYHVANYSHSRDTKFGQSTAARIFVFTGVILYLLPICFVPVDVEMKTRGSGAQYASRIFWLSVVSAQMLYIWVICPVLFAFYETDDKEKLFRRLWDAIRLQLPLFITLLVLIVPTYFLANDVEIPENGCQIAGIETNTEIDGEKYHVSQNNILFHMNAVTVILGQLLISVFGGIGTIYLPYNLLNDFIFRPKPLTKANFAKRQKILLPKLVNMRKEAKRLETDRMQVALMTGFQGYLRRFQFHKKMRILETCTILAEKEFTKLEDQADFNRRVDPLKYIGRLLLSIFTGILAVCLIIIVCFKFQNMFETELTSNPLDKLGSYVDEADESNEGAMVMLARIFCGLFYCFTTIYFIWGTHHGNSTIGQRHAFFTFYHMKENETLLNQFIANIAFNNVVSMGALQYATLLFYEYTRKASVLRIAVFNKYSQMNIKIKNVSILDIMFLISVVGTCILIAFRGSGRIRYNDVILDKEQRKKAEAQGKKIAPQKDILSMRFGEGRDGQDSDGSESEELL